MVKRKKPLNSGSMPRTDFQYEEFEGLLGDFYLSLLPLKDSEDTRDKKDYKIAIGILRGFAQRYNVQTPSEAVENPRAQEEWSRPHVLSNFSLLDVMGSFWRDFGVGAEPKTTDQEERYKLGRLILGVFDRHGIASVEYETIDGHRVATKLVEFYSRRNRMTIAEVMAENIQLFRSHVA